MKISLDFYELFSIILLLVITLTVLRGKLIKLGLIFIISYTAICIVDILIFLLTNKIIHISSEVFYESSLLYTLIDSISLILFIIVILIQKKLRKSITIHLLQLHWSYYLLLIWTLICFAILITYVQYIEINTGIQSSINFIISLIFATIGILTIVIMITRISYSRNKYKSLSQISQEYVEIQHQYYSLLGEKNEDIRRFQHDIKNHFLCMQVLSNEEKTYELKKYINELAENYHEIDYKVSSGHNIVDAIISDTMAKTPAVNIEVDGALPCPMYISATDLCIVFSNILSNAVEAVTMVGEDTNKIIRFEIKKLENKVYIKTTNPVSKKILIENNSIDTTKNDGKHHGYGLGNIRKCVEKYHGTLNLSNVGTVFILEIIMKNENFDRSPT